MLPVNLKMQIQFSCYYLEFFKFSCLKYPISTAWFGFRQWPQSCPSLIRLSDWDQEPQKLSVHLFFVFVVLSRILLHIAWCIYKKTMIYKKNRKSVTHTKISALCLHLLHQVGFELNPSDLQKIHQEARRKDSNTQVSKISQIE